jgi:hypothetical protein
MSWLVSDWDSLVRAAAGGLVVLAAGSAAARLCRQPVRRARLVVLTMLGALVVPWLALLPLPGALRWPAGLLIPLETAWSGVPDPGPTEARPGVGREDRPVAPAPAGRPEVAGRPAAPPGRVAPEAGRRAAMDLSALAALPWRGLIPFAYAAAATALLAWWMLGQALLWRIALGARPAPPAVQERFRALTGRAGARVRVLQSDRIDLPFTFTWISPVILLPSTLAAAGDEEALDYCLAHEWSHVERRDARAWNLAALAGVVLFYQPLFWWLRRQLRLCQDYLADDRAAALGSPEDYAAFLVRLARHQGQAHPAGPGLALPALGIHDRPSNLSRRVAMLINDRGPLEHRCPISWSLGAAVATTLALFVAAGLYADDAKPAPKGETLHYSGKVKELGTGKPIAGATVVVRRSILKRNHENTILQETRHTTDAAGSYSFTIPPEQVAERYHYIELDVEHPDYATQAGFGYALSMIRKNEKMGGRPFFENIELRPGKPIAGHVDRPDGSPARRVSILAYSRSGQLKAGVPFEYGSFSRAKTDEEGNFKLNVTTPGLAVFWILPDDLAGELHGVPEGKRGDLGRFTLKPGASLKGRVLDVQGRPIAGVFVNAERDRDEEANQILNGLAVADAINRTAVTGADGSFTLAPLPSGQYRVLPGDRSRDGSERHKIRPLPAVFTPRKVALKEGETPEPLEIRAAPHVVIEAQWVDGQGKPTTGFSGHIFGRIDGGFWFGDAKVDPSGKVLAQVPHGLEDVQLNLMTNEHHAIRWRKAKGEPLSRSRMIMLGTLDHDVTGIEIVHYNAPIVVVKAETKDKKLVPGLKVSAHYLQPEKEQRGGKLILAGGVQSDVNFEKQEDGRFRSEQLQPDLEVDVVAEADGFKPASRKVTLPEGKTEDITLVLEPK